MTTKREIILKNIDEIEEKLKKDPDNLELKLMLFRQESFLDALDILEHTKWTKITKY
jgi:hypothetical protein